MKKLVCAFAILAAAASTAAVAKDLKQDNKFRTPAAQQMTDSEMDHVTAGAGNPLNDGPPGPGFGGSTACDARNISLCSGHSVYNQAFPGGLDVGTGRHTAEQATAKP